MSPLQKFIKKNWLYGMGVVLLVCCFALAPILARRTVNGVEQPNIAGLLFSVNKLDENIDGFADTLDVKINTVKDRAGEISDKIDDLATSHAALMDKLDGIQDILED